MKQNPFSFCRRKGFFYERIPLFKRKSIPYNWDKSQQTTYGTMIPMDFCPSAIRRSEWIGNGN